MNMSTIIVPMGIASPGHTDLRQMSKEDFIASCASGTLQKAVEMGLLHHEQYLEERVAYEFGWEFQLQPASRVTFGPATTEGDCAAITETLWHARRYIKTRHFNEDLFSLAYITFTDSSNKTQEGIGLICHATSANWIGQNKRLFAIIAHLNTATHTWQEVKNPF